MKLHCKTFYPQLGLEQPIAIRYQEVDVISDWQSQHFGKYEKIKIGTAQCLKKGTETAVLSNGPWQNNWL
jgi:1-deoxy-D-xylulose-5-phosphate synthase